jgi:hypothetical protein
MTNIYKKINNINNKITSVLKDSEVSMGGNRSYAAVSHDAVTSLLHVPFAKEGIVVIPSIVNSIVTTTEAKEVTQYGEKIKTTYRADITVCIKFVNIDDAADYFECNAFAYALDTGDKAVGKAYSMAVKNAYLKVFMLESVDHEEERIEESKYQQKHINYDKSVKSANLTEQKPTLNDMIKQKPAPANHAPATGGKEISEAQIKRYFALAKSLGWDVETCKTNIQQQTQRTNSLKELTKEEYAIITGKMQAAIDSNKKELF